MKKLLDTSHLSLPHAIIQKIILSTRFVLVPLYVFLAIDLVVLLRIFANTLFGLLRHFSHLDPKLTTMNVLEQTDYVMIANFLVMMILGSYSTFVSPLHFLPHAAKPAWLDHVSAGNLKVKMTMSLVTISGVGLLPVFLDPGKFSTSDIHIKLLVHCVLMGTTYVLYLITKDDLPHIPHIEETKIEETKHELD